jgi:hypothetical protein
MLSGTKFPQNFRALRFVAEELLCAHIEGCESLEEMLGALQSNFFRSITTRLWVQNLIKTCIHHDGPRESRTRGRLGTPPLGSSRPNDTVLISTKRGMGLALRENFVYKPELRLVQC